MLRYAMAIALLIAAPSMIQADETSAPKSGQPAPDFTMTGIDGKPIKLSKKLASGDTNIVLLFSRANW